MKRAINKLTVKGYKQWKTVVLYLDLWATALTTPIFKK